jgi:putative endonuclease
MNEAVVYILLFSEKLQCYYVGQTENFENCLKHHNSGKNKFTSKGLPWKFVHKFIVSNRSEAIILESKIKKRGIKRYLTDIKFFGM